MTGLQKTDIITIEPKEKNETDLIGRLLEKYISGSKYDKQNKTWTVKKATIDTIKTSKTSSFKQQ